MTSDESALIALSHEYAQAVRHRDAQRWGATWVEDSSWVLGPGRQVSGRTAIVEMWSAAMAKYDSVVQIYASCAFTIDGAEAVGRCQLFELNLLPDSSRHVLAGHYDDTYRRTPQGWRYVSRQLTRYYSGPPDLSGVFVGPT
jgi:ketosteroid isomerase-like protein